MNTEHWQRLTLGEAVEPSEGLITGPFGSQLHASDYIEKGIPVVMPKDLVGGTILPSSAQVSRAKAEALGRYRLRRGDVVIARRGELGRCALVGLEHDGWLCGTGCVRARFAEQVEPRFFVQYLRWPRTIAWLESHAVGQTMANLNRRTLGSLPLTLPPLEEQRRLAEALEAVDSHVQALNELQRAELDLQRGMIAHLLQVPSASSWPRRTIGELAVFTNGHRFQADEWSEVGMPIIRIQNLRGNPNFKRFAGYAKDAWVVEEGELLFAWAGTRGSLGPTLWRGPRGVLNQHIFRIRPHDGIDIRWLYEVLRQVTREVERQAHGFKSTLLHLRKTHVTGQTVAVPPTEAQQRIAGHSQLLSQRLLLFEEQLTGLIELKKGLMEELFTGRQRRPGHLPSRHPMNEQEASGDGAQWGRGLVS